MNEPVLKFRSFNHIAWLTLNRPAVLNALNHGLIGELDEALTRVENDPDVRAAVITGADSAFCAGADLKSLLRPEGYIDSEQFMSFVRYIGKTFDRITELSKPVIAAVNGYALAGGLELALSCDLVVAARSARFGDAHANYGLVPGAGGAARLARAVTPQVARYLAFTGDSLPAADLMTLGLVNEVVDDGQLEKRVIDICDRISAKSTTGIAQMKRLINHGLDVPLQTALQMEHDALADRLNSMDLHEGLMAFREHRTPVFTDKVLPGNRGNLSRD